MFEYLVFVGVLVQLIGIFSYIKDTISGKTKPNRVSWLLWSIAPIIATVAALSDGVRLAVVPVFIVGFGPILVFISSFINPNSYWKLGVFDYFCGLFSILSLILWSVTKMPSLAIGFALVADFFACFPTIIKSWKNPESESLAPYSTGIFSALTAFFAIKSFGFSEIAFPIYLVLMNIVVTVILLRLKIFNKTKLSE